MLNKLKLKKSDIINVTYYALGALVTGTAVYLMTKNHYENIIVNLYETAEAAGVIDQLVAYELAN